MARRYHIPVYTTGGTADAISRMKNMKNLPEDTFHEIVEDQDFHIRDLTIHPFSIPHDAAPVSYTHLWLHRKCFFPCGRDFTKAGQRIFEGKLPDGPAE